MAEITDDVLLGQMDLLNEVKKVEESNKTEAETELYEDVSDEVVNEEQAAPAEPVVEEPVQEESLAKQYIGKRLKHVPGAHEDFDKEAYKKHIEKEGLSKIGDNIFERADFRAGWIDVDRKLLGERDIFYPEDWRFRIRPATVEAIRNWSTIDEENLNSIDDVFNEILKACVSIVTPTGNIPVGNIASWDRFFFLLLVRQYTFVHGESKIQWEDECLECENPITFSLDATTLSYDMPDPDVMKYYDRETRSWFINPEEFGIERAEPIQLYIPTVDKDANIKAWMISRLQENRNRKIDNSLIRFLMWLAPKISKDSTIAHKQIREYEMIYKSWDTDMFAFMDDVLRNIIVTPSNKLTAKCPTCGEEMTSEIRFRNSVRDLFNIQGRFKKFGKK